MTVKCINVTATWDINGEPCRDLSYNVTLSSSHVVTLGPFTTNDTNYIFIITNDTAYNFTDVDTVISINVFAFNEKAIRGDDAGVNVSSNG